MGVVILCQFIFKPGKYDQDFHSLDAEIDAYARGLPGFRGTQTWVSEDGALTNASYYFDDAESVRQLSRFEEHRLAKSQYQRWYDGYQIVVSEVMSTYGDGRLAHVTGVDNQA